MDDMNNLKTIRPIGLDLAMQYTQNWVKFSTLDKDIDKTGLKRSFRVEMSDLETLRDIEGYDGIRIYLGKESADDPLAPMHVILVAVDGNERDIIDKNDPKIFDFSMPCPHTCGDISSPLYTGKKEN